jgi:hypothetical protein
MSVDGNEDATRSTCVDVCPTSSVERKGRRRVGDRQAAGSRESKKQESESERAGCREGKTGCARE